MSQCVIGWTRSPVRRGRDPRVSIGALIDPPEHAQHAWANIQMVHEVISNADDNQFVGSAADKLGRTANPFNLVYRTVEQDPFDENFEWPWEA